MMSNIYKHRLSLDHYHSKFHPFCLANVQKEEKEPYWMENPLPNQEYPKNTMERIQYRSSPSQLTTHTELYPKQTLVVPFWHHEWKSWRSMHDKHWFHKAKRPSIILQADARGRRFKRSSQRPIDKWVLQKLWCRRPVLWINSYTLANEILRFFWQVVGNRRFLPSSNHEESICPLDIRKWYLPS